MSTPAAALAWYRFRATLARRARGYAGIAILIALLGGLSLGVIAGARRTQSSFSAFLKGTNPSDLSAVGLFNENDHFAQFERLPHVRRVATAAVLSISPLRPDGSPVPAFLSRVVDAGSVNGFGLDMDRASVTDGRMFDPARTDEVVMTAGAAQILGLHLHDVVPIGVFTTKQVQQKGFGTVAMQPVKRFRVTVVGIVKLNTAVVQDDVDANGNEFFLFTPTFTKPYVQCCDLGGPAFFQLDRGARDVPAVESEIEHALGKSTPFYVHVTSVVEAQAERAIKPESIALGVFGAIAALAAVLIVGQVIGRQLRVGADDLEVLRALGAGPRTTATDGLIGVVGAVLAGSLLAVVIAIALSPLAPIGPTRSVYPSRGIALDWTVLGTGLAVLVAVLTTVAFVLARRRVPGRLPRGRARREPLGAGAARAATSSGMPLPAVMGIRFALEAGQGRNRVPVRSAILGAMLAIVVVTATVTFGASLRTLVSHPALYGWNWTYEITTSGGGSNIPTTADRALRSDPDIAAFSGVYFDSLQVDGRTVPIMGGQAGAPVGPPILSGHTLAARDQIVLGATTLAELHKRVGDVVTAGYASATTTTKLTIVGVATMPAVGPSGELHLSMGTGALVDYRLIPARVLDTSGTGSTFEPNAIFVRLRAGVKEAAALASLRNIAAKIADANTGTLLVLSVQRPAEIVNYRAMGTTPALLGAALAVGAVFALGLTLAASVRRRRRDLALLKTLGFTRRQLAAAVSWQSSVAVVIGTAVGLPAGIIAGRLLWEAFARELHVVPAPTVPLAPLLLIVGLALVLANVVSAIPGRQAARTPTALLLRDE